MERMEIKEIRRMVHEAVQLVQLQRKGEWKRGLQLLQEAEGKTISLSESEAKPLLGLIRHYQGRILQAMGRYHEAESKLLEAIELRKGDPIGYGYSKFQLFICRDYGGYVFPAVEVKKTKTALYEWIEASQDPREIGDAFQNLAYVEQRQGETKKAIWFYQVAEKFREIANDERGLALTWARLGECYVEIGDYEKAKEYGEKALWYFEEKGDVERINQVQKNVLAKIQEKEKEVMKND